MPLPPPPPFVGSAQAAWATNAAAAYEALESDHALALDTLAATEDMLATAQAALVEAEQALAEATALHESDLAVIAALTAEIARLEDLLGSEEPYTAPVMGAATLQPGTTHFPALETYLGETLGIRRVFTPGLPSVSHITWDLSAGRTVAYSFKQMPADGGRAFVRAVVDAITPPQGRLRRLWRRLRRAGVTDETKTVYLTVRHEPENDGVEPANGSNPAYQPWVNSYAPPWRAQQIAFQRVIAEETAGKPVKIIMLPILMEFTAQTYARRNWRDWYTQEMYDAGIRIIGWDLYQPWQNDPSDYDTFRERAASVDRVHDEIEAEIGSGVGRCLPEYGHPEVPGQPLRKTTWLADAHAWAVEHHVPFLTYFNFWQVGDTISNRPEFLLQSSTPVRDEYARQARIAPR